MSEMRLPMDPLNPGQFFACCGLFELAARKAPEACARFEADENTPHRARFVIEGDGLPALQAVLASLRDARFTLLDAAEEAVRPVRLEVDGEAIVLDWWLDPFRERTTSLKCWAGQVTTRKLFEELPPLIDVAREPMFAAGMTKSKFGVDPRSAWNTLDFGFSPNVHNLDAAAYPAVEVLAAVGLQGFRPNAERREVVAYHLWGPPLPLPVARRAAIAAWEGLPRFDYRFEIAKRGQSYKFFTPAQFRGRKAYYR